MAFAQRAGAMLRGNSFSSEVTLHNQRLADHGIVERRVKDHASLLLARDPARLEQFAREIWSRFGLGPLPGLDTPLAEVQKLHEAAIHQKEEQHNADVLCLKEHHASEIEQLNKQCQASVQEVVSRRETIVNGLIEEHYADAMEDEQLIKGHLETISAQKRTIADHLETLSAQKRTTDKDTETISAQKRTIADHLETISAQKRTADKDTETISAQKRTIADHLETISAQNKMLTDHKFDTSVQHELAISQKDHAMSKAKEAAMKAAQQHQIDLSIHKQAAKTEQDRLTYICNDLKSKLEERDQKVFSNVSLVGDLRTKISSVFERLNAANANHQTLVDSSKQELVSMENAHAADIKRNNSNMESRDDRIIEMCKTEKRLKSDLENAKSLIEAMETANREYDEEVKAKEAASKQEIETLEEDVRRLRLSVPTVPVFTNQDFGKKEWAEAKVQENVLAMEALILQHENAMSAERRLRYLEVDSQTARGDERVENAKSLRDAEWLVKLNDSEAIAHKAKIAAENGSNDRLQAVKAKHKKSMTEAIDQKNEWHKKYNDAVSFANKTSAAMSSETDKLKEQFQTLTTIMDRTIDRSSKRTKTSLRVRTILALAMERKRQETVIACINGNNQTQASDFEARLQALRTRGQTAVNMAYKKGKTDAFDTIRSVSHKRPRTE